MPNPVSAVSPPHAAALAALAAGISVVPPRADGSKRPLGEWKQYQTRLPTDAELFEWYVRMGCIGTGVVPGQVSGNLEGLEFDRRKIWLMFRERAEDTGMLALVDRIANGYLERSPNGYHLLYTCDEIGGNTKLAQARDRKTLIETRGEGGYLITAPSNGGVNPAGSYVMESGGFGSVVHITQDERAALHALAATFNEILPPERVVGPAGGAGDGRPGDEYIAETTWADVLEPHGWVRVYVRGGVDCWRRPGKDTSISATTGYGDTDLLYVFSTSTPFENNRTYNRFGAYAVLNHGGDYKLAAADLQRQGYGAPGVAKAEVIPITPDTQVEVDSGGEVSDRLTPPVVSDMDITPAESEAARLHPRCIVENHTYADVAQVVAPGGTGKTTVLLYEAIMMALGWDVWGCKVLEPGWTLFITAEDRREQLVARIREIARAHDLRSADIETVFRSVRIWDVTGRDLSLVRMVQGSVILTTLADAIVTAYQEDPPVQVIFDPLVSFGASEGAVNDNEQGIVCAARRIVNGLDCCVRVIHHTGKANAREKTLDQYSGRGGSAMADGSRMTTVLQSYNENDDSSLTPPHDLIMNSNSSVIIIARPKLSYAPPNLPNIWVQRTGFMFEYVLETAPDYAEDLRKNANKLAEFLINELDNNRYHTERSVKNMTTKIRMTRANIMSALAELEVSGRVRSVPLPPGERKGRKQDFLCPSHRADLYLP